MPGRAIASEAAPCLFRGSQAFRNRMSRTDLRMKPGGESSIRAEISNEASKQSGGKNRGRNPAAIVLVGFAEALSAPETVWSLLDGGFHVIAFARKGRSSALRHSRHVVCHEICAPESDLQASLSDLRSLM